MRMRRCRWADMRVEKVDLLLWEWPFAYFSACFPKGLVRGWEAVRTPIGRRGGGIAAFGWLLACLGG